MIGYVYYVLPDAADEKIAKIGMSTDKARDRTKKYGTDCRVIRKVSCDQPRQVEAKLIQLFNKQFKISQGREYFAGDSDQMLQCFDKCVETFATEPVERNIDVDQVVECILNILGEILPGERMITQDEIFEKIKPMILETAGDVAVKCIDYVREHSAYQLMKEFIVPHSKLIEYGITTSRQSNHIKERLVALGLTEDKDFIEMLDDRPKSGRGGSNKKIYTLTPRAFKCCLMRANLPWYRSYILLLEDFNSIYIDAIHSRLTT
jgi:T5orf172 domain